MRARTWWTSHIHGSWSLASTKLDLFHRVENIHENKQNSLLKLKNLILLEK